MNKRTLLLNRCAFLFAMVFSLMNADAQVLDGLTQTASKTPTLAYSLRKLKAAYTGPAVRVRNANNTESVDVYFDANGLVSLNSPVSAAGGGVATATTLTTWVGSGTAFITTWYDQSGNARDAINTTSVALVSTSTLTTNGTAVTLGTAMGTALFYDFVTSAATTNNTLKIAAVPSATITKMAITGAGIPDGTFAQSFPTSGTAATTPVLTKTVNVPSGSAFRAYGFYNTYQPGQMLIKADGTPIGIIKSIESSTALTLVSAAPENTTYATSAWGLPNQPTLVRDGIVETMPGTAMPAMRAYNGYNSGTRFLVTSFANDGVTTNNLQSMKNVNLFAIIRQEGNFNANNGCSVFATTNSGSTSAPKFSFSETYNSTFTAGNFTQNTNFPSTGVIGSSSFSYINTIATRLYLNSTDGTTGNGLVYNSSSATALTPPTTVTLNASLLDATQIGLLGLGNARSFEGLASEIIFYGSTTTTNSNEADAVTLYNNEALAFVNGPTVIDPTVTSVTATSATIGGNVAAEGKTSVTARGTYYDTNTFPTANGATASGTTGTFTRDITGLTSNTKYYYRAYATNTGGTNYTVDGNFTTLPAAPIIAEATGKSIAGFTANWTAPTQGAEAFTYTVEYGTASDLTGATAITAIASTETSSVISGLNNATTYYYRVKALNATGSGAWSDIKSVVTSTTTGLETAKASVLVLPNPALDQVTVTLSEAGKIEIYDPIGKMVYSVNGKVGSQTISVTSLNRGLYIVKASNTLVKLMLK